MSRSSFTLAGANVQAYLYSVFVARGKGFNSAIITFSGYKPSLTFSFSSLLQRVCCSLSWWTMREWRSTVWRCWATRGTTLRPCTEPALPSITWVTMNVLYATCVTPRTGNPQVTEPFAYTSCRVVSRGTLGEFKFDLKVVFYLCC